MRIVQPSHQIAIAILRFGVGVIFLWAGLEKIMAPEPWSAAGFLEFGTGGSLGWPFVPPVKSPRAPSSIPPMGSGWAWQATRQRCR